MTYMTSFHVHEFHRLMLAFSQQVRWKNMSNSTRHCGLARWPHHNKFLDDAQIVLKARSAPHFAGRDRLAPPTDSVRCSRTCSAIVPAKRKSLRNSDQRKSAVNAGVSSTTPISRGPACGQHRKPPSGWKIAGRWNVRKAKLESDIEKIQHAASISIPRRAVSAVIGCLSLGGSTAAVSFCRGPINI